MESFKGRLDAEFEDAPAGERRSPGLVNFRDRLAGKQANFDGTDEFLFVGGGDLQGGLRVKMSEHFVEIARAVFDGREAEAVAEFIGTLREVGEAFEKGAEIESG